VKQFVQVWILRLLEWLDVFLDNIPRYSWDYEVEQVGDNLLIHVPSHTAPKRRWYRYGDWGCVTVGRIWVRLSMKWEVNSW
jgi:hypothetical protein